MMRSMYSAVSSLRIHQGKMDTIGNNIANVNTIGFKRGQVSFQEVFSQVTRGASAPQVGKGGTNPQQIGMGASVGSINTIHTIGSGQRTDNPTDLMISGEGFFAVSDDPNFDNRYYTRAGNFTLDRDGNLVTAEGLKVLGYSYDEGREEMSDSVTNIRINKSETKAPTGTEKIYFKGNLNSETSDTDKSVLIDTVVNDSLGNSYKVTFKIDKAQDHSWNMSINRVTDMASGNYTEITQDLLINNVTLNFNSDGEISGIGDTLDEIKKVNLDLNSITFEFDKNENDIDSPIGPNGYFEEIVLFDPEDDKTYKDLSQYANETDIKPFKHDGNRSGVLEEFTIDATGTVVGIFSNGERKPLGQIMLAKFDNNMGLQKVGGNLFLDTRNSGEAQLGRAGSSGLGNIEGGTLEMSNVDIALEFTEMITTQRGFQANSRIITTSDEMLQELVNMKR